MYASDFRCVILVGPEGSDRLRDSQSDGAPRLDYRVVAALCTGAISEWLPAPSGLTGPRLARVGKSLVGNAAHAHRLLRSLASQDLIYSTGETWGLPVALVGTALRQHRPAHVVYAHRTYSRNWLHFLRATRHLLAVDGWICITQRQAELLREALGPNGPPVAVVSQGVDTAFFDPDKANPPSGRPYILAVGAEMRNYPLLFEAARQLDSDIVVKASSSWMMAERGRQRAVPPNVRIVNQRISFVALRDLYAGAALVVVPLYDTLQAAGITTILEAMAMRRCIIATHSAGLPDVLVDSDTGIIVESSAQALKRAILAVLSDPRSATLIAERAYTTVRAQASLEAHVQGVISFLDQAIAHRARLSERR